MMMVIIAIIVFFVLGEEVPAIDDDVEWYTNIINNAAVMPIYPLYSYFWKHVVGEANAFMAMVIFQGILASVMTIGFTLYIRAKMQLSNISTIIVYLCTLLPFLIYLPRCNITQIVLTESLAFPFTYLLVYFCLRSVYDGKIKYCIYAMVLSFFLYLLRSELLVAIALSGLMLFIQLVRLYKNSVWRVLVKLLIAGGSMILVFATAFILHNMYLTHVVPALNPEYRVEETVTQPDENVGVDGEVKEQKVTVDVSANTSQFRRLIANRGCYLLHDEDYVLYDDIVKQGAYLAAIDSIRANDPTGLLQDNPISYAKPWDTQGMVSEKNVDYAIEGMVAYYQQLYPNGEINPTALAWDDIMLFAVTAIVHHPGELIATFVRLFFAGLQASIFYQPQGLYVVAELITLAMLLVSLVMLVVGRKSSSKAIWMLRIVLLGIVVYDGIVSAVHFPLQRYLVYFQGMYFVAMYVTVVELYRKIKNRGE